MKFVKRSFSEVYSRPRIYAESLELSAEGLQIPEIGYSDGTGFHLYSLLSLTQQLTSPVNLTDAQKAYEVTQRYVDIADACARNAGGRILEVQGECLHFFFDKELNAQSLQEVITFCSALTNSVYKQKNQLGGVAFEGFKICFDYGRAIIMSTGHDSDDSFVSLGPCANEPAKHLPDVKASCTAMPTRIAKILFPVDQRTTWHEIDLQTNYTASLENFSDRSYLESLEKGSTASTRSYSPQNFSVKFINLSAPSPGRFYDQQATLCQGFFIRADLDGFTKKVQDAFDSGTPAALERLLEDFEKVLNYGNQYVETAPRPIYQLPWAGDCANILLLPKKDESIDEAQTYLSAVGPADWLSGYNGQIQPPFKDANWVVSSCCGQNEKGGRNVLLATVKTADHNFLFAIGWSVGRSLDAHNVGGSGAGDTLISNYDHSALDDEYRKHFNDANSNFKRARNLHEKLTASPTKNIPTLTEKERRVAGTPFAIQNARPYCNLED